MSISRTLMVTLNQDKANTEDKFYIYRDDVGVDIYVEISNLEYQFNKKKNGYRKADVLFKTPSGDIYKVENLQIRESKIKFSFTQDIVDKMQEIGKYELQFQLYDNALNRLSLPPYKLEVKEPFEVPTEDEEARVEYSRVGYAHVAEDTIDLFAIEDGYIRTTWQTGDLITASRLNNLEEGVEYLFTQMGNTGSSTDSQTIFKNTQRIIKLEKDVSSFQNSLSKTKDEISTLKGNLDKTNTEITQIKEDINEIKDNGTGGGNFDISLITYKSTRPSTIDFGGIKTGYLPPEDGINVLDLLDKAMHPYIYTAPRISFSISPSTTLYELGFVISTLTLRANVTKGIEEITEVGILQSGTVLETSNTSFSKTLTNIRSNTSFSAYVTDGVQRVNSNTIGINFINPIYVGNVVNVTEEEIKNMTKKIVNVSSQSFTYNIDTKRMCIAVPSGWNLKSVIDPNNFNITSSFVKTTVNITCLDGIAKPYSVYYSDYTSQSNFTVKFNF